MPWISKREKKFLYRVFLIFSSSFELKKRSEEEEEKKYLEEETEDPINSYASYVGSADYSNMLTLLPPSYRKQLASSWQCSPEGENLINFVENSRLICGALQLISAAAAATTSATLLLLARSVNQKDASNPSSCLEEV